ncbi:MAG: RagB/SusD family nutrient uptake outer membrane protein [Prolixibacteraceae bacterium]
MNPKKIILLAIVTLFLGGCDDYLDPYPNGDRSKEDLWEYQDMVQGLVGQCYENMPRNYDNNEGAYLDCATDNAVRTSTTDALRRMAVGTLTTGQNPFLTYWDRDYKSINLVNMFLENNRGFNTRFIINEHWNDLVRRRLQGEAFALRAWFQWDLLQKFGGKGVDGNILGFPIVLKPIDYTREVNLTRNTYDECVQQIFADCDSAYKYLPVAHRDFLVEDVNDKVYAGGRYWGRMDGITTRAIKALVYLTWASPRFNPGNDQSRWDKAAQLAKEVIDFKLTVDGGVTNGFNPVTQVSWTNPNFPGIVWSSRYSSNNDAMERMFYPGGFLGNGTMGASQELVDAFPMKNGYPITDQRSEYDPSNPYQNRDPRFYSVIFHNNAQAKKNNTGAVMYTFENWAGGKDAAGSNAKNSRTNYHIKKFVFMGLNWSDASVNRQPHSRFFVRWAHMLLTFAEAANHVVGPTDASKYGLSAKDAMKYLRERKTYDGAAGLSTDPYLEEVSSRGETVFDAFVKNERRIETCFEGNWFFDLRRWSTSLTELNKPVHGVEIVKNEDGSFDYHLNTVVEQRSYQSAYLPIPYEEILRMSNLVQNEGWDAWK